MIARTVLAATLLISTAALAQQSQAPSQSPSASSIQCWDTATNQVRDRSSGSQTAGGMSGAGTTTGSGASTAGTPSTSGTTSGNAAGSSSTANRPAGMTTA